MYQEKISLPLGVILIDDLGKMVFKKAGKEIVIKESFSDHSIVGERFANIQYQYMKLLDSDDTGTTHGTAYNSFCIDLLTFKYYSGYARKLFGLYFIQDNIPEILDSDDSLTIFTSIKDTKGWQFCFHLPIMSDNEPFLKIGKNLFYVSYLNPDTGEFDWVVFFDVKKRKRWKRRIRSENDVKLFAQKYM